jgi:hypothetical protein
MRVSIKDLAVRPMDIKNKGVELDVYNGSEHLGDLVITKTVVIWCKGKTTRKKGIKVKWPAFIKMIENISS